LGVSEFPISAEDAQWELIQQSGTIHIGTDASYPPFEFVNSEGYVVGLDVDLGNEIAGKLGLRAVYTNIAYDGLYDALLTGRVDILISALADLPQAAGKAMFTNPYFNAGDVLVVKRGSRIKSMEDLANSTIAVEFGSNGDAEARLWERRVAELTINRFPDSDATIQALLSGKADAAIVDGITARINVATNTGLELSGNVSDTLFAIAVHSHSPRLREKLNEVIKELLNDGTVERLIEKWFVDGN
jgi:polar amino acid transport system substrate-binding protein